MGCIQLTQIARFNKATQALATTAHFVETTPYDSDVTKMLLAIEFNTNWLSIDMGEAADIKFQADLSVTYKTAAKTPSRRGAETRAGSGYPESVTVLQAGLVTRAPAAATSTSAPSSGDAPGGSASNTHSAITSTRTSSGSHAYASIATLASLALVSAIV
ncbi:hypothetical protein Pelo_416 [Pelomyxa schiedti]|nr:hypothetical protein Pelo_416 [Pelomyxa schiedti]